MLEEEQGNTTTNCTWSEKKINDKIKLESFFLLFHTHKEKKKRLNNKKSDYILSLRFACMIFLTMASVQVFFPGRAFMARIILSSAFHLSWRLRACE